jgi:AcrR family transcriptional regulator
MTPTSGSHQRKQPKQERSQATVTRILDTAGQVLSEHGYEGCTTGRIADEAGLSKGSIYQYFSDKDAILQRLATRLVDEILADVGKVIDANLGDDLWTAGEVLLAAGFDAIDARRDVLRSLLVDAGIDLIADTDDLYMRAHDIARTYFAANADGLRRDIDVDAITFVLIGAGRSMMVSYAAQTTDLTRERLITALTTIATATMG